VRDKIPEIIHQAGGECEVVLIGEPEYRLALQEKLMEAKEVANANLEDLVKELADLWEVIDTVLVCVWYLTG
jgi:predicted house-cleaning noncanonical NTP pyrophosphatase (MazG superfamily)